VRIRIPKTARAVGAALVLAVGVAACGDSDDGGSAATGATTGTQAAASESKDPITIGYAVALTGPNNAWDGPILGGAKVAVEDINKQGGINGRPLEIITVDNKSDLTQVASAAQQALEKGAEVIVPSCDYDFGSPAAREAMKKGVLAVGCAGDPRYGKQGVGDLMFNIMTTTNVEAVAMADLAEKDGLESPYLLVDTTIAYSKSICDYFKQSWEARGKKIAGEDTFKNSDASVSGQVNRLRDNKSADSVVVCSFLPGGPGVIKQIRGAGIDLPIITPGSFDGDAWLDAVPKLSNFKNLSMGAIDGSDGREEWADLAERYEEVNGEAPPTAYGPLAGYSEIQTIAKALELADGSTKGEDLAAALESAGTFETAYGPTTFTEECHTPQGRELGVSAITNGKRTFEAFYPVEAAIDAPC
jgi:branched-chain amino acid transport system substrate-binding protein